jgi:hypothetical protein
MIEKNDSDNRIIRFLNDGKIVNDPLWIHLALMKKIPGEFAFALLKK